jgi:hypothetical protein
MLLGYLLCFGALITALDQGWSTWVTAGEWVSLPKSVTHAFLSFTSRLSPLTSHCPAQFGGSNISFNLM